MSTRRRPYRLKANTPCCALDDHGDCCSRKAVRLVQYFGDRLTIAAQFPDWVLVPLCDKHSEARDE
jgi:hypothetical protein